MKKRLAVIFGGSSVEHEISIITAIQAMENMDKDKYDLFPIYISKENNWFYSAEYSNIELFKDLDNACKVGQSVSLNKNGKVVNLISNTTKLFKSNIISQIDLAFLIVHGTNVEDGTLSGYLKTLDLIFVGPSVTSGVTGQDKAIMKDILKSNEVNQTKYMWFFNNENVEVIADKIVNILGEHVIIKPANLGSSIGISVASTRQEIINYVELAFEYDHKIVVEELLTNFKELNISICGDYANMLVSPTEEVVKDEEFLSYEDKYMSGGKTKKAGASKTSGGGMASLSRIIPANISDDVKANIEELAKKTYLALNCQGVVRIDVILVGDKVYINEVNSIPGSLAFYLWEAADMPYTKLIDKLIEDAVKAHFNRKKINFTIESNVLNMQGVKTKK